MYPQIYEPKNIYEFKGNKSIRDSFIKFFEKGLIPQVMIFHGMYGVGKTLLAKIVAKWLNCENKKNGNPCEECQLCLSINNETFIGDVIYQKANSSGGKDDMKELEKRVYLSNLFNKNKVIIIEEAHNLSSKANEVLLTVLQNPPPDTYFIFITTEYEKIKNTVKSRCMSGNFHFQKASIRDLKDIAAKILKHENYDKKFIAEKDSGLSAIIDNCEGSIRNFISLLERCVVCEYWTKDQVLDNLGLQSRDDITKMIRDLLDRKLSTIKKIYKLDYQKFYKDTRHYLNMKTIGYEYPFLNCLSIVEKGKTKAHPNILSLMRVLENVKVYPYFDLNSFIFNLLEFINE